MLLNTFSGSFPNVCDFYNPDEGLIFGDWFKPLFYPYPRPLLNAHRVKLIEQNEQGNGGRYQADNSEPNGPTCSYFNPTKRTIFVFFLSSVCGLAIGLYLISKSDDLIAKSANRNTDLMAYSGNLMRYGGYAISLFAPFASCLWLSWRIVVCHGSPFLF
jgi:hypothetical protein